MSVCSSRAFCLYFNIIGFLLSGYAFYVEMKVKEDPTYKPLCDLDENISCTKPFNSTYGKGFGVVDKVLPADHWLNQPNPIYGFGLYSLTTLLSLFRYHFLSKIQFYVVLLANFGSIYLGYILYFVLENLCVVCVAIYATNFLLLIASFAKMRSTRLGTRRMDIREHGQQDRNLRLPTSSNRRDFKKNI